MSVRCTRRSFLEASAAGAAFTAAQTLSASLAAEDKTSPNEKMLVGVMGVNGRGSALARSFAQHPGAEVAYVCDVDERALGKGVGAVDGVQKSRPQEVRDFRRMLDDPAVDVLVVAAPNHWHAPATILGCAAGKHVYVEKPCSHTPREGELAIEAARKYNRVVTMGSQRRSRAPIIAAIEKLHSGAIGKVLYSRTWYTNRRGPIGKGTVTDPPSWLDYTLWQGPAPDRPYKDNLVHYNWHWHWHWGNGELGNNGVHALDVARWGLGVDYPTRVTASGGRYRYDDDQETPDTHLVAFDFDGRSIHWEGLSWSSYGPGGSSFGVSFHGEEGSMLVFDSGYTLFDVRNKEIETHSAGAGDAEHLADFFHCIRNGGRPTADIEVGHKSTLLCHLGNIAYRVSRTLHTDPKNGRILGDEQAAELWDREYRAGWAPKV